MVPFLLGHPVHSNRAQCRLLALIEANVLTTTPSRQTDVCF